jgi:hypothetical protein
MYHLKDAPFGGIDQICRLAFAGDDTTRAFDSRDQCLETKLSVVTYFYDT